MKWLKVYPACAGIDPWKSTWLPQVTSLPRMRGDRPDSDTECRSQLEFTPHARGSTGPWSWRALVLEVYPACAGIDLASAYLSAFFISLPRMRGDRPRRGFIGAEELEFTPHARGSTEDEAKSGTTITVYPACAGIDLLIRET